MDSDVCLITPISLDRVRFHIKTAWPRVQGQKCAVVVHFGRESNLVETNKGDAYLHIVTEQKDSFVVAESQCLDDAVWTPQRMLPLHVVLPEMTTVP